MISLNVYLATHDVLARAAVLRVTGSLGLSVESFRTIEEFTQVFDSSQLAVSIYDVGVNTVTREQLQRETLNRKWYVPLIVLLDQPDTANTVRTMKSGAVTVLDKPFKDKELQDALLDALNQCSSARSQTLRLTEFARSLETLSDVQRSVLDLVLEGVPNKSIASILGISVRTVEMRRSRIYKCLRVDSVAQLVRRCIAASYIDP
jgi:FixJ family two-component response regulator